jgi:ubiquinone/menaquinone biosynthesis C-methylase UbiE
MTRSDSKDRVRAYYDSIASSYDETRSPWTDGYPGAVEKDAMSKLVKRSRMLNLACGTGRLMDLGGPTGLLIVGIDISRSMLRVAKAKAAKGKLEADLIVMDAEHLAFQEAAFDTVCCSRAFKFLNGPTVLREVRHVLKDSGRLILSLESNDPELYYGRPMKTAFGFGLRTFMNMVRQIWLLAFHPPYENQITDLSQKAGFTECSYVRLLNFPVQFYGWMPSFITPLLKALDKRLKRGLLLIFAVDVANSSSNTLPVAGHTEISLPNGYFAENF